jgi:hypothetical protein
MFKNKELITIIRDPIKDNVGTITLYDVVTKQVLGANQIREGLLADDNYLNLHINSFFSSRYPSPDYVPEVIKTVEVDSSDLINIIKVLERAREYSTSEKEATIRSIRGSSVARLTYWLELQWTAYQHSRVIHSINELMPQIAEIHANKKGSIRIPNYVSSKGASNMPVGGTQIISTVYNKLHYPFSDTLKIVSTPDKNKSGSYKQIFNLQNFSHNNILDCIEVVYRETKKESATTPELSQEDFLPTLVKAKETLAFFSKKVFGKFKTKEVEQDTLFFSLKNNDDFRQDYLEMFKVFNLIKNNYILLGEGEVEATYKAVKCSGFTKESSVDLVELKLCEVTKQLLPVIFLLPYKTGYISTVYAHTQQRKYRFVLDTSSNVHKIIEVPLNKAQEYDTTVYQHSKNALSYLSIRKLPYENTTITCKESLFNPTPFMGIELEVEQVSSPTSNANLLRDATLISAPMQIAAQGWASNVITQEVGIPVQALQNGESGGGANLSWQGMTFSPSLSPAPAETQEPVPEHGSESGRFTSNQLMAALDRMEARIRNSGETLQGSSDMPEWVDIPASDTPMPIPKTKDVIPLVYDKLGRDYVILKRDGSLRGDRPFEIVTVPATLGYHKQRWKALLEDVELKKHLSSFTNERCGMHVHINRMSFTGLHLAKFMKFINCTENLGFVTSIAQRKNNKYAVFIKSLTSTGGFAKYFRGAYSPADGMQAEKYAAVNTKPTDTIEVRIFRGNLAKIGFLKNLEFVHAVWMFTKDAPLTSLTFKEFMFWLFNPKNNTTDYKELKMWLLASGWKVDGVIIKKTDPEDVRKTKLVRRNQVMSIRKLISKKFVIPNDSAEVSSKIPANLQLTQTEIVSVA